MRTQTIVTLEYGPAEEIIRAPLGRTPGRFGAYREMDGSSVLPDSFVVNSKSEIYILDILNQRIQKYSPNGEYLLSLPVDSWKDESGGGNQLGINLSIDWDDNIYFYCVRNNAIKVKGEYERNPNPKGEIWMFTDDKFVKKWSHKPKRDGSVGTSGFEPFDMLKNQMGVERRKIKEHGKDRATWEVKINTPSGKGITKEIETKYTPDIQVWRKTNRDIMFTSTKDYLKKNLFDSNGTLIGVLNAAFLPLQGIQDGNMYYLEIEFEFLVVRRHALQVRGDE